MDTRDDDQTLNQLKQLDDQWGFYEVHDLISASASFMNQMFHYDGELIEDYMELIDIKENAQKCGWTVTGAVMYETDVSLYPSFARIIGAQHIANTDNFRNKTAHSLTQQPSNAPLPAMRYRDRKCDRRDELVVFEGENKLSTTPERYGERDAVFMIILYQGRWIVTSTELQSFVDGADHDMMDNGVYFERCVAFEEQLRVAIEWYEKGGRFKIFTEDRRLEFIEKAGEISEKHRIAAHKVVYGR